MQYPHHHSGQSRYDSQSVGDSASSRDGSDSGTSYPFDGAAGKGGAGAPPSGVGGGLLHSLGAFLFGSGPGGAPFGPAGTLPLRGGLPTSKGVGGRASSGGRSRWVADYTT